MSFQYDISTAGLSGYPTTVTLAGPIGTGDYFHIVLVGSGPPVTVRVRVAQADIYTTVAANGSLGIACCEGVTAGPPPPPP